MKILICHNRYRVPGGEDHVADEEARLLSERGHSVARWGVSNEVIAEGGVRNKFRLALGTVWSSGSYRRMRSELRRVRPDVAHFHNTFPLLSPAVYYACRTEGVPVVQSLQNYRLVCPAATFFRAGHICEECTGVGGPWRGVVHGCYRGSRAQTAVVASMLTAHRAIGTYRSLVDVYVATTEAARERFIAGGLPANRIVVKPNFVHAEDGDSAHDGNFALYVGRLVPEKGIRTLLRAWPEVGSEIPLRIVGNGPLEREVGAFAATAPNVVFAGHLPRQEVARLIRAATLLVFPSEWYEGLSLVLLEALAAGTPIVASDLPSFDDLVRAGENGWRFRTGDPLILARTVTDAWRSKDELARSGRASRQLYLTRFAPDANYSQLVAIYERALGL